MIPILFAPNTTTFTTNGLGRLADAITCTVTEERNGKYELEMEYPVTGIHYSDIQSSAIIYAVPADGKHEQPFRIYRIDKIINGRIKIYAEHITYQANHIPVAPFTATTCAAAMAGLASNAMSPNPFTLWTDKQTVASYNQEVPETIRARLGGQDGSILDLYGGEFEWDHYTIKLHSSRGSDNGVTLRYGKNITDLSQEHNITTTYTAVCPYYKISEYESCITLPEHYIASDNAGNYPYLRIKTVDMTKEFQDGEDVTVAALREKTRAYIEKNNIGIPKVSIKVSFVALWQTDEYKNIAPLERVNLCDTVTVIFEKLGVSAKAKVTKTVYNVLVDRYNSIELGEAKSTMSEKIVSQEKNIESELSNHMQIAIKHATELITGGLGGYVVFKYNANGKPEEILVMDTPSTDTAVNVIRINRNGIGFSTNGYNGPFRTAWTIDSHFVADFIDTGTLNADLIKAGIIQDEAGLNYWNMVTGDFRLTSGAKIGNSTIASSSDVSNGVQNAKNYAAQYDAVTLANAKGYADGVINDYDESLDQLVVFNKLTNNGAAQGIYLQDGNLYVNASVIKTGILADINNINYWNLRTGDFQLSSNARVGGKTVSQISNETLNTFVTSVYNPDKVNIQSQIDGKAETWYQAADPAASWSATDKAKHEGDLWYRTTDQTTWFYTKNGSTYQWVEQDVPIEVFDEIDGKAQIFISQPTTPYSVGDLWFQSNSSDIMTCITARDSGSFRTSDWQKRNKYVDQAAINTSINNFDTALNQQKVFNKLTNNGALEGIYMKNGRLYINASYIASGAIADASGNTLWDLTTGALSSKKFSIDSNLFKLDESGKITSITTDGKKLVMEKGTITGFKSNGVQSAKLEIGDGLFNIVGKLALNGVVGVSGNTSFVKGLDYDEVSLGSLTPITIYTLDSLNNSCMVSGGSATLSNGAVTFTGGSVAGNVSVSGYVDGKYCTLSGYASGLSISGLSGYVNTACTHTNPSVTISGRNTMNVYTGTSGHVNNLKYLKAVSAASGTIKSADGLIQSIS